MLSSLSSTYLPTKVLVPRESFEELELDFDLLHHCYHLSRPSPLNPFQLKLPFSDYIFRPTLFLSNQRDQCLTQHKRPNQLTVSWFICISKLRPKLRHHELLPIPAADCLPIAGPDSA